jgi:signal peptidase II
MAQEKSALTYAQPARPNLHMLSVTTYLIIAVIMLDQFSKRSIAGILQPGDFVPLTSFFNVTYVWNHGLSYIFYNFDCAFLVSSCAIVWDITVLVILNRWRLQVNTWSTTFGLGLAMGGLISSIFDHMRFGAVTDIFDLHIGGFHICAFGFAEIGLVTGIGILILEMLFAEEEAP